MALVIADRVKDTTTSVGTGTITLSGSPPAGFQSFAAVGDGNTTYYTIAGQGTAEWEVGIGTYTAAGTTLSRDTVLASSAGGTTKVTFSAGTKDVFVTLPAERTVTSGATTDLVLPAPGTSGNVLTSNGSSWVSQVGATAANVQTFTTSGTWTKPAGASFVLVEAWGAGGGGGRPTAGNNSNILNPPGAGGGGGAYNFRTFLAADLPATVTATIGAGGTGGSTNGASGGTGGTTTFGSFLSAYGGGGGSGNGSSADGSGNNGGSGGGTMGVGITPTSGANNAVLGGQPRIFNEGNSTNVVIRTGNMGGGAGGGLVSGMSVYAFDGAPSSFGGGGGGGNLSSDGNSGAGGSSANGGAGGGSGGRNGVLAKAGGSNIGTSGGGGAASTNPANAGTAGSFRQGGGGGYGIYNLYYNGLAAANNGTQTVVVAVGNPSYTYLLVSTNGLSSYTPYFVDTNNPSTANIIYDGSKYVFMIGSLLRSTTDFTNFTTYATLPIGATSGNARDRLVYANGYYFICGSQDLYYSTDLTNWTRANINGGTNVNVGGVAFDGTRYYAVASANPATIYVSTNLTSWTGYNTGANTPGTIAASSSAVVVSSGTSPYGRVSTDGGVTWANIGSGIGSSVSYYSYISSTTTWVATASGANVYYTSDPTSTWTLSTDPATAYTYAKPIYNGARYVIPGTYTISSVSTNNVAIVGSDATFFAWQTATAYAAVGSAGGAGGFAGGGGGGGGSGQTTTGNGGKGGDGYCRVYTW